MAKANVVRKNTLGVTSSPVSLGGTSPTLASLVLVR